MNGFVDSNIHILKLDVTEDKDVEDVIKTIIEREGRIDILVNNAGSAAPGNPFDFLLRRLHVKWVFGGDRAHTGHDDRSSQTSFRAQYILCSSSLKSCGSSYGQAQMWYYCSYWIHRSSLVSSIVTRPVFC